VSNLAQQTSGSEPWRAWGYGLSHLRGAGVGLDDRGVINVGRRADLIRIKVADDAPIVREVYREGRRVV
jgi:alpha-D-ribose 1-methylphosphonate 5-triphosphate diphosphatase PhnM